mmetsp:Transcript_24540/g.56792  ORF Transcript_24540/g.56792 Transcript_24540/m.56792 type:complete len:361 (+) Transcript_24540:80-1162(+)
MVKRVGKYEIGRTLGEGTFGKVKQATNVETGQKVAIKILDKEKIHQQSMGEQIKKEINVMKMVKHKHVVNLLEVLASKTKIFIVLELIRGGELFDKIVAVGRFDEAVARKYFRQLVSGVDYCHRQQVCHRDLKPENLLLDEHELLKISDFGLSALYGTDQHSTLLKTTCGTPNYVAPEVLADKGYSGFAADIWSCGVILFVLLAGFLPFDEPAMSVLFRRICKGDYTFPAWFGSSAKGLLGSILRTDPAKRATIEEIKASAWYREGGFTEDELRNEEGTSLDPVIAEAEFGEAVGEEGELDLQKINAFELITMLGGIDLTPMFDKSEHALNKLTRFASKVRCCPCAILVHGRFFFFFFSV